MYLDLNRIGHTKIFYSSFKVGISLEISVEITGRSVVPK